MKKDNGFTLIEFIIYISIVVVLLVVTTNFGWNIIYGNIKSQAIREVQQNARFSMERITRNIEQAVGINSPVSGDSANFLSLQMSDPNLDPTVFDVSDGNLRITQGTNGPYNLTNERVEVTNLQFKNLSYEDTPGILKIEMTIDHINPTGQSEYDVSFSFNSSASLRPGVGPVVSGWYHQNWLYRKKITILASQIVADLSDFPVLISITDPDLSKAQADGDDILFTSSDGVVQLNHEIEDFDYPTTKLVAWVKSDISSTQDTDIYIYYANSGAPNQENPTAVWDSNYAGVWHLGESSGTRFDSTSNNNDLSESGTVSYSSSGIFGNALDLDISPEGSVYITDNASLSITDNMTISAWVKMESLPSVNGDEMAIVSKWASGNYSYHLFLEESMHTGYNLPPDRFRLRISEDGTANHDAEGGTGDLPVATWHYVTAVNNGTDFRLYLSGILDASGDNPESHTQGIHDGTAEFHIGRRSDRADEMDGLIDEVRVSNIARTDEWILTSYNNQDNPSGFYNIGIEESPP